MEQLTNESWSDTKSESSISSNWPLSHFHKSRHLKSKTMKHHKIRKQSHPPITQMTDLLRSFNLPTSCLGTIPSIKERSTQTMSNTNIPKKWSGLVNVSNKYDHKITDRRTLKGLYNLL